MRAKRQKHMINTKNIAKSQGGTQVFLWHKLQFHKKPKDSKLKPPKNRMTQDANRKKWILRINFSVAISCLYYIILYLIANSKKYLQSDWLREVQYWPYLHSVFNICTLWLNKKKQKIQHSISVAEI